MTCFGSWEYLLRCSCSGPAVWFTPRPECPVSMLHGYRVAGLQGCKRYPTPGWPEPRTGGVLNLYKGMRKFLLAKIHRALRIIIGRRLRCRRNRGEATSESESEHDSSFHAVAPGNGTLSGTGRVFKHDGVRGCYRGCLGKGERL